MGDGTVRPASASVSMKSWNAALTPTTGDVVGSDFGNSIIECSLWAKCDPLCSSAIMRFASLLPVVFASISLVIAAGCSSSVGNVTGEVTVDGVPLQEGTITFTGAESKADTVTEEVKNGKYRVVTNTGKKHVQIRRCPWSSRKKRMTILTPRCWTITQGEILPERYHSNKSFLNFEVMSRRPISRTGNSLLIQIECPLRP